MTGRPIWGSLPCGVVLAAVGSTVYDIVLLVHLVAVIAAFGPPLIYPSMVRAGATQAVARLHLRLALPALALVWVLGMGLVGLSEDVWELTQAWILISLIGWVVLMAASWFLIRPALTETTASARSRLGAGIGITHLLLVVILTLMVFKPGL